MTTIILISTCIFLAIFVASAAMLFLSYFEIGKLPQKHRDKLFKLLIIEVISIVISFVGYNLRPGIAPTISEKILLNNNGSWDWCYPNGGWRSRMDFYKDTIDGSLKLKGTTFYYIKDSNNKVINEIEIYDWETIKPIKLPLMGNEINIDVTKKTLDGIKFCEPGRKDEIGRSETGVLSLNTNISLEGSFLPYGKHQDWGVVMNYRKK